ncbi:hypothetical protein PR048_017851 [Dryococelus australis]|uniref:PiggyBac transposable element-derived protein domain-containing protein n=1 Tax=Dryococelus australis TaxID=614101 RepID=A0ABQ9HAP2_9NEOP|nr:hypothetical protein PR048_017851 [Dryococelus australis]
MRNILDGRDKMGKIRPLLNSLNENIIANAPVGKNIFVGKAVILYFGRYGCKEFLRFKPVRFDFKAWVVAQGSGYCLAVDVYQGKHSYGTRPGDQGLGKGPAVTDRLDSSSPTKANRVQYPAGSDPDFRKWESGRTMTLVGGFTRGSPASPHFHSGAAPYSP